VNGTAVEKYLWQGRTRLLAVYDGSGALKQRFEYADGRLPVAMTVGGTRYFLVYDQVGSLRAVLDSSGGIVKTVEYDSFGNVIADSNSAFAVPFGFAGGLYDADTGLTRFGYRDYDADVGRWTAKDPIGFEGGDTDLYGYVVGDPVNGVDPVGLDYFNQSISAGGIVGGIVGTMITGGKIYTYAGMGLMTPGFSYSATTSPSTPSVGWNFSVQGQYAGLGGSVGYSQDGGFSYESGTGVGTGIGIFGYYVNAPELMPDFSENGNSPGNNNNKENGNNPRSNDGSMASTPCP